MIKLNRPNQAKNCFMEALSLDVKCYESFMHLVSSEMLTVEEGVYAGLRCAVYNGD